MKCHLVYQVKKAVMLQLDRGLLSRNKLGWDLVEYVYIDHGSVCATSDDNLLGFHLVAQLLTAEHGQRVLVLRDGRRHVWVRGMLILLRKSRITESGS